jgi:hypothetical protein
MAIVVVDHACGVNGTTSHVVMYPVGDASASFS